MRRCWSASCALSEHRTRWPTIDPEVGAMREKVGAILGSAAKTGALDEAALGELPEQIAVQVGKIWAEQRS